ncbi:hypothetical protein Tco_0566946 [Tanacetum coccineum]
MSTLTFADTHNMVAFLEKPAKSNWFHEIIDFLNANQIRYALTVNPTIYTSCIEQFWATTKVKTVNGECQLQALVEKKKVIIIETSIRSDLNLEDAGGTDCLPTDTIFKELVRIGYEKPSPKLTFYKAFFSPQWKFLIHTITQCLNAKTTAWNEFSSTMASEIICLATNQKFNLSKYIFDAMLGDMSHHKETNVNPLHIKKIFANMKREGKDFSGIVTPLFATMMKKQSQRKQRKDIEVSQSSTSTEPMTEKETNEEFVPKHSYDPSQSGEDRMQLHELMNLCTKLSDKVSALETTKTTQALEIASLKSRVKKLEKKTSKRTYKFKRLYRVGTTKRVESSNDEGLGAQEDASKQGRSIEDIDKDAEVSLVDETQGRSDDTEMFDTDDLIVGTAEIVSTAEIKTSASPSTIVVSPPVITESRDTIAPSTIPKAKGITFRDAGETTTRTPTLVSSSSIKDKGKAKLVEPGVPLNKKNQIRLDEELARRLDAKEQEAARLESKNEQEQGELTIEEKSKLFMELMNKRKRHIVNLKAEEKRRKPLTKGQRRNQMCTYLKNMGGFTHNQLKNKSYEEIQKAFDKIMGWINNFKPMDSKEVKSSRNKVEGSRKKLIDEHKKAEENDKAEMKKHMEIIQDDEEIAIVAIPLATKPSMIVEYKIVKEGQKGFYHLIRADGSSNRYSSMLKMLQNINREDLETLWKLVKTKHLNTRPEDDYERVFWVDMKVMFKPDIKSEVWMSLQGYNVMFGSFSAASSKVNAAGLNFVLDLSSRTKPYIKLRSLRSVHWDQHLVKEKKMTSINSTIHMVAPKSSTYNGRPRFANPKYLKKAQSKKPCLYEIPYDKDDLANIFSPYREKTLTLEQESRLKLNKGTVKPYDYTKQNSLYEIFKPSSREYLDQLAHANEIQKKM